MKTLKESLLDDEEDLIDDEEVETNAMKDWVEKNILNNIKKDNIKFIDDMLVCKEVVFAKDWDGTIPSYIKWHPRYIPLAVSIFAEHNIKSFENFPTKIHSLSISSNKGVPDFETAPKNISWNNLFIFGGSIKSLKGLTGTVKKIDISKRATGFKEFDSNDNLKCDSVKVSSITLDNIDNCPKTKLLNIMFATVKNVTGHEKQNWIKLAAEPKISSLFK